MSAECRGTLLGQWRACRLRPCASGWQVTAVWAGIVVLEIGPATLELSPAAAVKCNLIFRAFIFIEQLFFPFSFYLVFFPRNFCSGNPTTFQISNFQPPLILHSGFRSPSKRTQRRTHALLLYKYCCRVMHVANQHITEAMCVCVDPYARLLNVLHSKSSTMMVESAGQLLP